MIKLFTLFCILLFCSICFVNSLPMQKSLKDTFVYGPAFDEIIVNSSLNIRKKNSTRISREAQHKNVFPKFPAIPKFPEMSGGAAAGSAQSQAFNAFGPTTNFGASSTGAQTQAWNFGKNGLSGTAGFSGTQKYNLPNGGSVNIDISEAFSAAAKAASKGEANANAVSLTYKGPDGKIIPIKG